MICEIVLCLLQADTLDDDQVGSEFINYLLSKFWCDFYNKNSNDVFFYEIVNNNII